MEHFADHCAFCHGIDGSGQTQIGRGLYPPPPDMRIAATQQMSDGEIYTIIRNGVRFTGMPAFGEDSDEPDLDSWKLVLFIRHLPEMKPEEIEHMESMLPKSPMELQQQEELQRFLSGEDKPR
jgi:mono/diheme cytochrome c family protein